MFSMYSSLMFCDWLTIKPLLCIFCDQVKATGSPVNLEVIVEPRRRYTVMDPKGKASRLKSLEVRRVQMSSVVV